jgi:plasmid maintenance system antidote protein VapI
MLQTDFNPDWVSPPGRTIQDILDARGVSVEAFCEQIGCSKPFFNRLLNGYEKIDSTLALCLENKLGVSQTFWLSRDGQYWHELENLGTISAGGDIHAWISNFPIYDMRRQGWLFFKTKEQAAHALLRFFSVKTPNEWSLKYGPLCDAISFKKTDPDFINYYSIVAWLHKGAKDSEYIDVNIFDRDQLKRSIGSIVRLTWYKDPNVFMPKLKDVLSKCGVAIVAEPCPKGCTATGAAWTERDQRATIVLSDRYKMDDHFWFAVFHEIGHLVLHDCSQKIIEESGQDNDSRETEANEFARNIILPENKKEEILSQPLSYKRIQQKAKSWRIAPGLLVGQLQHERVIHFNQFNKLRRRINWAEFFSS